MGEVLWILMKFPTKSWRFMTLSVKFMKIHDFFSKVHGLWMKIHEFRMKVPEFWMNFMQIFVGDWPLVNWVDTGKTTPCRRLTPRELGRYGWAASPCDLMLAWGGCFLRGFQGLELRTSPRSVPYPFTWFVVEGWIWWCRIHCFPLLFRYNGTLGRGRCLTLQPRRQNHHQRGPLILGRAWASK